MAMLRPFDQVYYQRMGKHWESYFLLLGVVLLIQGIGGIFDAMGYDLLNGFFFVNLLDVFDGFEIFVNIVVAVLGVVVLIGAMASRARRRAVYSE